MMREIDQYVESLYRHVKGDRLELTDLKDQMKAHLAEKVDELQSEGRTKEDSLAIAFEKFGNRKLLDQEIKEVFRPTRPLLVILLTALHLIIGIGFIISSLSVFRNGLSLGNFMVLNEAILYGALGIISAIGMWMGRRWGWCFAAFVYVYGILNSFQYVINIPIFFEQLHFNKQRYFIDMLYFILFAVLSLVFWKKEIQDFYDVKNISWFIKIMILVGVTFLFSYLHGYVTSWLVEYYFPGSLN